MRKPLIGALCLYCLAASSFATNLDNDLTFEEASVGLPLPDPSGIRTEETPGLLTRLKRRLGDFLGFWENKGGRTATTEGTSEEPAPAPPHLHLSKREKRSTESGDNNRSWESGRVASSDENLVASQDVAPDTKNPSTFESAESDKRVYRVVVWVNKIWNPKYLDQTSPEYHDFANEFAKEIDNLYKDLPGEQFSNVVQILNTADPFYVEVSFDLVSVSFPKTDVLKKHIQERVQKLKIGKYIVSVKQFSFRESTESPGLLTRMKRQLTSFLGGFFGAKATQKATTASTTVTTSTTPEPTEPSEEPVPTPAHIHYSTSRETRSTDSDDHYRTSESGQVTSDDEDLSTSGDVLSETEIPLIVESSESKKRVFRVIVVVKEFWDSKFLNRMNPEYQEFANEFTQEVDSLFKDLPGEQFSKVVGIQKTSDSFSIKVSFDLVSINFPNTEMLRNHLQYEVDRHKMGKYTIENKDFSFRDFTDKEVCPSPEKACPEDGETCFSEHDRCDGRENCPDGSDEMDCPAPPVSKEIDEPFHKTDESGSETGSAPPSGRTGKCRADDQQTCADGLTVICTVNLCDGETDCPGGDDEENCHGPSRPDCGQDEFMCDVTRCVMKSALCNGVADCKDETDEQWCDRRPEGCREEEFRCNDGRCIPFRLKCDMISDCSQGEDEHNCSGEELVTCGPRQFTCTDGSCIDRQMECDSVPDCRDGSDEGKHCKNVRERHLCPSADEFLCDSGTCVPLATRCDGKSDCPQDGSDEIGCSCSVGREWQCDDGSCIDLALKCDGKVDCPRDSSDEPDTCPETLRECHVYSEFTCRDGGCIPVGKRCDDIIDCRDNSDEQTCPCKPDYFKCQNGFCIPPQRHCDGTRDCQDGTDEQHCDAECGPNQNRCRDGSCYNRNATCNHHRDCLDGSDEENCNYCKGDQFRCYDGTCISQNKRCDRRTDCAEGEDEKNCRGECPAGRFSCSDGSCIHQDEECDGRPDCPDGSDEDHCASEDIDECLEEEFRCADGLCIAEIYKCDSISDCSDHSDETDCPNRCGPSDVTCGDGTCVRESKKCDGQRDCNDGADERNCRYNCSWTEYQCSSGECIDSTRKCDGQVHCRDGSDERDCGGYEPPTTASPLYPTQTYCSPWEFRCLSRSQCIDKSLQCNGRRDCSDGSDEENCAGNPDLDLKTYPPEQTIKETIQGREVVFQCRDEGLGHIPVRWVRADGQSLPPNSRDYNGRLEMPNIQVSHSGTYYCEAVGIPLSTFGARVPVHLKVEPMPVPTRPTEACGPDQATCYNRQCIPKDKVCDGRYDCGDGSDESRCNPWGCEPNEFQCDNRKCVRKSWRCDSDDDCGDGSDEKDCEAPQPGSRCHMNEFECRSRDQCIPKWFHCDSQNDCQDGSDEIGCYPLQIKRPPPPMIVLNQGETFTVTCLAVGVPTPVVSWRLNWHHIPTKCTTTSVDGLGTLTCPSIQEADQGAYSCEAMDSRHSIIAQPDTHLKVNPIDKPSVRCPAGSFNDLAKSPQECISCFCFGKTTDCNSADLFVYQLQPPLFTFKLVNVQVVPSGTGLDIRKNEESAVQPVLRSLRDGRGFEIISRGSGSRDFENVYPYFAMPENYHGNQLKSYGGFLHYTVKFDGSGQNLDIPDLIVTGNGYTLSYKSREPLSTGDEHDVSIQLLRGEWRKIKDGRWSYAEREDIMMTLVNVDNILIRTQYLSGPGIETVISNIQMDSASVSNTGKGQAALVEQCRCPTGYTGLSCEQCAPGYMRRESSPWLGSCYKEIETCPPGTYGDPYRGITCQPCPCPLTSPYNQFGRTCRLDTDGQVTCDCPSGYMGRRCERCSPGYSGNPLQPGDYCRPGGECDPAGSLSPFPDSSRRCQCKEYATGPTCNQCKANTFLLSTKNPYGCISCFCMGVTSDCSSSNWYRDQVEVHFTRDSQDVELVSDYDPTDWRKEPTTLPVRFDGANREIVHDQFEPKVYYWKLPASFLGDKVTAYGGNLTYTFSYTPTPGGQSSRNTAPDVHLQSLNKVHLEHFSRETVEPDRPVTLTVPLLEDYWQREDGTKTDREHLLIALADVSEIYIKATYTTNTREARLKMVSLDTATPRNTGLERAVEVEQCECPVGYRGLSCEDCDAGYTRVEEGLYLGLCEPCACNGVSEECHPETGVCMNCRDNREGPRCEECLQGYTEVDGRCEDKGYCDCDRRGSLSTECDNGRCQCKTNVMGNLCNQCRPGTFGMTEENPAGCLECYCSGVTSSCQSSNLYREEIPVFIFNSNHGFSLTRGNRTEAITTGFILNTATNEIGYDFSLLPDRDERYFWSLPSLLTGDKVLSYGGKLTFTQRYETSYEAYPTPDQDIIISGNGISIFWSFDDLLSPNRATTLSVPLEEGKWRRLDARSGQVRATRAEILKVLSNVEAILVRASISPSLSKTYLSDIIMETAVSQTRGTLATQVEVCRCPPQYKGTSCELCSDHYYRDFDEVCKRCPCSNNEETCTLGSDYKIRCVCRPGFTGASCDIDEEKTGLMIHLRPLKVKAVYGSFVLFNCSYRGSEPMRLSLREVFKSRTPSVVAEQLTSEMGEPYYDYRASGQQLLNILVRPGLTSVVCEVITRNGEVAGLMRSEIVAEAENTVTATYPEIPGVRIVITISEPEIRIVEVGSSVRYTCQGVSIDERPVRIKWSRQGGSLPPGRAVDDSYGLLTIRAVQESDSGVYVCTATDSYSTNTKQVQLTVAGNRYKPPVVRVTPDHIDARDGDPIDLRCDATGYPSPTLQWLRTDGKALSSKAVAYDGRLRFQAVTRYDEGEYECRASNQAGSARGLVTVYVQDKARPVPLTARPSRVSTLAGQSFTVVCEVSSPYDSYRLEWTKRSDEPLPYGFRQSNGVLSAENAAASDSGVYICTATSESTGRLLGNVEVNVDISTIEQPPVVDVEPEKQTVPQGSTAELRCIVSGDSPRITWTRAGQPIPSHAQVSGSILRIPSIQVVDRGVYVCKAETASGQSNNKAAILEVERREAPLVQLYPSDKQVLEEGSSVQIQCVITQGIPSPRVYWTRPDNSSLPYSIQQLPDNVLRITSVRGEDGGEYVCHAENAAGSTTATAVLTVRSRPRITVTPATGVVNLRLGQRLSLKCQATGTPTPTVEWNRHSQSVFKGEEFISTPKTNEAYLDVYQVGPEDQGTYICRATSPAGSDEERVEVRIDGGPTRGDIPLVDPEFTTTEEDESDILVELGSSMPIECSLQERNERTVERLEWRRSDGRPMDSNIVQRDGTLYINDAARADEGTYSCIGLDALGRVLFEKSRRIRIIARPRITLNPPTQVVRPGDNPFVNCLATGDQPIDISWEAVGRPMPRSASTTAGFLQFRRIMESEAGRYVCRARNNVGEAEAVAEVIIKDTTDRVRVSAVEKDLEITEGMSITLRCQTDDPTSIEWTRASREPLSANARQEGTSLVIESASVDDSGRYICTASSSRGFSSNDYIELRVNRYQGRREWTRCTGADEFECAKSGECIRLDQTCDKHPHCRDGSDEAEPMCGRNYRLHRGATRVELKIQPSIDVINVGDTVDLRCVAKGVSNSALQWSKVSDRLASNIEVSSNLLRISDVTTSNAGVYRCSARTPTGTYEDDFILKVKGMDLYADDPAIETKAAFEGQTVLLNCRTVLEPPVTYTWSKQRSTLPSTASHNQGKLSIPNVVLSDAGMYVCTASNGVIRMDIPTIVTVSGSFPSFSGSSYAELPPTTSAYLDFEIEIFFKPEQPDGLILYNGQRPGPSGDFISLGLRQGVPEFRFNVGSGPAIITATQPVEMDKWHSVKITRQRKEGKMWVDDHGPYEGQSLGRSQGLDLLLPLYIGGVPDFSDIHLLAGFSTGFVGCISTVKIGGDDKLSQKSNMKSVSLGRCESCTDNPCSNNGVCQEAANLEGYTCICPRNFSGHDCTKYGESCYDGICGSGKCIDSGAGIKCKCQLGFTGSRCEREVSILIPSFADDSYMAYPTPRTPNKLKVNLKFNPADNSDGLLLYSAQMANGQGDFVSLAIKNRRVEFKFDTGSGPVFLRSNTAVKPGEWTTVTAGWDNREAHLVMSDDTVNTPISLGQRRDLNLRTHLYMGGHDQRILLNPEVGVDKGFRGCISQIEVNGLYLSLVSSVVDSDNVEPCSSQHTDPCRHNPCSNAGECVPSLANPTKYSCRCRRGYSGTHCELEDDSCSNNPCQRGGTCVAQPGGFKCNCPIGTAGAECQHTIDIGYDISLKGDGYVELSSALMSHEEPEETESFTVEFSTTHPDGVILWHGQPPDVDGREHDYLSLAVVEGHLELSYELGSGPAELRSPDRVDDGRRHMVTVKRQGTEATVELDTQTLKTQSQGYLTQLNTKGNIYIGGMPDIERMTGRRFSHGFNGCIHRLRLPDTGDIEFESLAKNAVNIMTCSNESSQSGQDEDSVPRRGDLYN